MSWRRLCSRAGVPSAPRKYFVVTMVEALTLQKSGNSTPFCSKTTSPVFQLVCTTSRRSQFTSSYGCSADVKTRSMLSPAGFRVELWFSDRPFAERVVSVISAFLVSYRHHHWRRWIGEWPPTSGELFPPGLKQLAACSGDEAERFRGLRVVQVDHHWCAPELASTGAARRCSFCCQLLDLG